MLPRLLRCQGLCCELAGQDTQMCPKTTVRVLKHAWYCTPGAWCIPCGMSLLQIDSALVSLLPEDKACSRVVLRGDSNHLTRAVFHSLAIAKRPVCSVLVHSPVSTAFLTTYASCMLSLSSAWGLILAHTRAKLGSRQQGIRFRWQRA